LFREGLNSLSKEEKAQHNPVDFVYEKNDGQGRNSESDLEVSSAKKVATAAVTPGMVVGDDLS
jgi:hypothetical protein